MVIEQIGVPRIPTPGLPVSVGASFLSANGVRFITILVGVALIALVFIGYRRWMAEEGRRLKKKLVV